jgi:hypothetical protein
VPGPKLHGWSRPAPASALAGFGLHLSARADLPSPVSSFAAPPPFVWLELRSSPWLPACCASGSGRNSVLGALSLPRALLTLWCARVLPCCARPLAISFMALRFPQPSSQRCSPSPIPFCSRSSLCLLPMVLVPTCSASGSGSLALLPVPSRVLVDLCSFISHACFSMSTRARSFLRAAARSLHPARALPLPQPVVPCWFSARPWNSRFPASLPDRRHVPCTRRAPALNPFLACCDARRPACFAHPRRLLAGAPTRQLSLSYLHQHATVVVFVEFTNALLPIRLSSLWCASLRARRVLSVVPQRSCLPLARVNARAPARCHCVALALRPLGFTRVNVYRRAVEPVVPCS